MFCPNCGNNCFDAKFCPNCGKNLRNAKDFQDEQDAKRYFNHNYEYLELDDCSVTIYRKPLLMKPTKRIVQYSQIKAVSYVEAHKLKQGGFLSLQDRGSKSGTSATIKDAAVNELSIVFSWKQNESFLEVYEFLKNYADRAYRNHQAEKWPTPAQCMIDDAEEAREYEREKGYIPAQLLSETPERFTPENLSWHPGKKKAERKAKISELDKTGQVYCPKCLSTSITANKKGFGIGKAVIGLSVAGGLGLTAGNIGAKKVICTCLKCGYHWKAGTK